MVQADPDGRFATLEMRAAAEAEYGPAKRTFCQAGAPQCSQTRRRKTRFMKYERDACCTIVR